MYGPIREGHSVELDFQSVSLQKSVSIKQFHSQNPTLASFDSFMTTIKKIDSSLDTRKLRGAVGIPPKFLQHVP